MPKTGGVFHEKALDEYIFKSKNRIIKLDGFSPDGIEVYVEGGIIKVKAIEVLSSSNRNGPREKRHHYSMFDDVEIIKYNVLDGKTQKRI